MKIVNREQDSVQIIELGGKIMGGPGETELSETLNGLIDQNKVHVILDMTEVVWIDSGGLGICLGGMTRLRNRGGDLRLVGLPDTVSKLLKKCRLLSMFQSFDTVEQAIKSF
jgi:anti-sigma B factor antagonist